mmetsp:Transcript_5256/g.14919  ORF Transcript_5256/g.14919 Transcript_5256/m.14919 type:complete len:440 (-) Transcript_5256:77-1396(-)
MSSNRPPDIIRSSPSSSSVSSSSRRRQLRQFYVAETTQHHDTTTTIQRRPRRHHAAARSEPEAAEAPVSATTDESYQAQRFDEVIAADHVNMDDLREVCWNGIPSQRRAQAWQHLLGYLPLHVDRRTTTLKRKRDEYKSYVEQHWESSGDYAARTIEERKMIHQIQVDCPRTEPNLPFFKTEAVQRSLERLLLTWSYRNPASGYVQGMNDLVALLYMVFLKPHAQDSGDVLSEGNLFIVEADVFWCFSSLINQILDHYVQDQPGIQRIISEIDNLLQKVSTDLWQHFQTEGVPIFHFTFKWINCILTRELPLTSAARLWDSLLSEGDDGFEHLLICFASSLLHSLRGTLLEMRHDQLLQYLTQEELQMSPRKVEEMISQAFIYKMTVSTEPVSSEKPSGDAQLQQQQQSPPKESVIRSNVLDSDEDILQAMMTSDYFLL